MEDVDAGDGVERDGNVEVEMAGLGIVDAEAVDEDEGLLESSAADGEVGLHAFGGAGLEVEGRVGAEEVDGAVGADGEIVGEYLEYGAIAFGQRERLDGGGDLDAVDFDEFGRWCGGWLRGGGWRAGCLGECCGRAEEEQGEAGECFLHGSTESFRDTFIIRRLLAPASLISSCYK